MPLIQPTFDALRWLGGKSRVAGPGYMLRRAADAWSAGGIGRIRAHLLHAAASGRRERRYQAWMQKVEPGLFRDARGGAFDPAGGPCISILVPTYNTPPDMLRRCIRSVLKQTYANWQLCVVDDHSPQPHVAEIMEELAAGDDRIHFRRLPTNLGIADATNEALQIAAGEYIALLDHDDELAPQALECVARRIAAQPDLDFVYSDEDKIDENGHRHGPAFKPGFSPQFFLTCNYICHLAVIRTDLVKKVGGLHGAMNGAQDYDLFLRVTEAINNPARIAHIPLVLYHWRTHRGSTAGFGDAKPYAIEAGRRALQHALKRRGIPAHIENGPFKLTYRVRPEINPQDNKVHVYIRNHSGIDRADMDRLTRQLLNHRFVSSVTNVPSDRPQKQWPTPSPNARWVLVVAGELTPQEHDWMERLIEVARQPGAGPVAPKIIGGFHSVADAGLMHDELHDHFSLMYAGVREHDPGYLWSLCMPRNVSALTGRCVLMDRDDFAAGRITGTPAVENAITMLDPTECDTALPTPFAEWLKMPGEHDPLFNPNLAHIEPDYAPWRHVGGEDHRVGDH